MGVESIEECLRQHLRWFGHVLRSGGDTEVGGILTMEVTETQGGKTSKVMEGYGRE